MLRLLIVLPSWVGDVVMATPALRRLRNALPGAWIGGLARPGIDAVMNGSPAQSQAIIGQLDSKASSLPPLLDEIHIERPRGVMGHKHTAARLRQRRYDAAILLTNSFSTALSIRMAGIRKRVGFDRDGRGFLLTQRTQAPKRTDGSWAIVPAVDYYWHVAGAFLGESGSLEPANGRGDHRLPSDAHMELPVSDTDERAATELLGRVGVTEPFAILNPGGNNHAKRWTTDRFAEVGRWLSDQHGLRILVNGSPNEADVVGEIVSACPGAISLPEAGGTLGGLKSLVHRASIMLTNDTGPRHFAVALGTPVVTLFGPTDHRWTSVPALGGEVILTADPSLPETESANDHPERCAVDRITTERVIRACGDLLERGIPASG